LGELLESFAPRDGCGLRLDSAALASGGDAIEGLPRGHAFSLDKAEVASSVSTRSWRLSPFYRPPAISSGACRISECAG
jgi:hypothetical protein